ncbi:MAG TPA: biosynthetic peptidoglycan transglycosylase [Myxococcota bacterium]|nr:biosynthetic peptidoglycan transglycosylase [Myxococcota bacterium]HPB50632.1 biosynthetic peptidoglycan transglycosylase [Myxococcota bacterium]HQP95267.1 biosynthetic peptidoglycan transglycosylase [Myxococcota bacterium]
MTDPQGSNASPTRNSVKKRRAIVAAATLGAMVLAVLIALPFAVRHTAASRLDRAAASMNGRITHGGIKIVNARRLLIPDMTFTGDEGLKVTAGGILVEVDPLAMVFGGRRITSISIERLDAVAGTDDTPLDLSELTARLTHRRPGQTPSTGSPEKPAKPRTAKRNGSPLPNLSIYRISGSINTSFFSGQIDEGSATITQNPDSLDAFSSRASVSLRVIPAGGQETFKLDLLADIESGRRLEVLSARVTPPFRRTVRGVDVEIGGLTVKPGEITIVSPAAFIPGSRRLPDGIRAEEVMVKWSFAAEGEQSALNLVPERFRKYLPDAVSLALGQTRISELRVNRPVLRLMPPETRHTSATARPSQPGPATALPVQARLAGVFTSLLSGIQDVENRLVQFARDYDGTRVSVTGASLTYIAERPGRTEDLQSLSNLDILLGQDQTGSMTARVRFECPESASTLNELNLSVSSDGAIDATLKAANLKLAPYRIFLPTLVGTDSRSSLSGTDVKISLRQGPRFEMTGTIGVSDVSISMPEVASDPMTSVDLSLTGTTLIDGPGGIFRMNDCILGLGEIRMPFTLDGTWMHRAPKLALTGRIERLPGESLLTSIPREAIPVLAGARLSGTFAATIDMTVDTANLSGLAFSFKPDLTDLVTIDLGPAVNLELLRSTFLHRIEAKDRIVTRTIGVGSPGWTSIEQVPAYFIKALTICEDARFFEHHGFSQAGIQRSLKVNLERGGFFQGASTLSQQLVKNLFLSREKTLSRKLQEAFITWQVERNLPKEKILELYLNVIEWGPDVWGIKEAANHYFAKDPAQLTVLESAFLVLIIPSPTKYHEFLETGRIPPWFLKKIRSLVESLRKAGAISELEALSTIGQTVRFPSDSNAGSELPDSEFSD